MLDIHRVIFKLKAINDDLQRNDRRIKKTQKNKLVMIMDWYSIAETDAPEDINSIRYLK